MPTNYPRLNFALHWETTNENLIELIELVPEEPLDWSPAATEWSTRVIVTHIILARYYPLIVPGRDGAQTSDVVMDCRTKEGLKRQLRSSWEVVSSFLLDPEKLDLVYEPPTGGPVDEYIEPEVHDGHYIAFHRMAHDLHHRSTIIGHLGQLGISLAGHRMRPL